MIESGTKLGTYEVSEMLGRGGMGEVWRARDARLGRDVAIKVLPEVFSRDRERLARFEREARLLATLNHPNIAAIYGLEEVNGRRFLILELVEGQTLADRLESGPLAVDEALEIARDIAQALEAAHDSGIIHRDLKPHNIKIAPDGRVKVLDFGLAKAAADGSEASRSTVVDSPTITAEFTAHGVVLGTAPYMSPEQARGRTLDKRTDIWSFGCVLYECLVGRRPFMGETTSDTIAQVLERDPDYDLLPASTPGIVRHLLGRCLQKDRKRRLRDVGDGLIELDEALSTRAWSTTALAAARNNGESVGARRALMVPLVLLAGVSLGALAMRMTRGPYSQLPITATTRLSVQLPNAPLNAEGWSLSPSGRHIAWIGRDADGGSSALFLRSLATYDTRMIAGTSAVTNFVFSPDGQWIAFVAPHANSSQQRIARVAVDGQSPVTTVAEWRADWDGLECSADDHLIIVPRLKSAWIEMPISTGKAGPMMSFTAEHPGGFGAPTRLPAPDCIMINQFTWDASDPARQHLQRLDRDRSQHAAAAGRSQHNLRSVGRLQQRDLHQWRARTAGYRKLYSRRRHHL